MDHRDEARGPRSLILAPLARAPLPAPSVLPPAAPAPLPPACRCTAPVPSSLLELTPPIAVLPIDSLPPTSSAPSSQTPAALLPPSLPEPPAAPPARPAGALPPLPPATPVPSPPPGPHPAASPRTLELLPPTPTAPTLPPASLDDPPPGPRPRTDPTGADLPPASSPAAVVTPPPAPATGRNHSVIGLTPPARCTTPTLPPASILVPFGGPLLASPTPLSALPPRLGGLALPADSLRLAVLTPRSSARALPFLLHAVSSPRHLPAHRLRAHPPLAPFQQI